MSELLKRGMNNNCGEIDGLRDDYVHVKEENHS